MKKRFIGSFLALMLGFTFVSPNIEVKAAEKETRAAWVSTVLNLDFPKTLGSSDAQKREIIEMLDGLQSIGINTVVFQVRPTADALYKSKINPWSNVLTGVQGKDPSYDPLEFIIDESHKRDMELHAWLNPYRITMISQESVSKEKLMNTLSSNHPAKKNPDMVLYHGNALYYNPELDNVKKHIVDTVTEIVKNYDVDAIHFDDYFYPSNYPLPQGEGKDGKVANERRGHVNDMVEMVSKAIKKTKSSVKFGISPIGIWKNEKSDSTGSKTAGNESYYAVSGDTRTWIVNEWIDYVVPQIYWNIGHSLADYKTLVGWWSNEVKGTNVDLYIGQGIYVENVAKEIKEQLTLNKKHPEVKGSMFFRAKFLIDNEFKVTDAIKKFYKDNDGDIKETVTYKKGTVTASTLNVRKGNSTSYGVVTKINKGAKVTILETKNKWHKIKTSNGKTGWVSGDYIKITTTSTQTKPSTPTTPTTPSTTKTGTVTASTLNVRKGNSTSYGVVTKINKGAKVTILETKNKWHKIKTSNGKTGWVSGDYIKVTTTSTSSKPSTPTTPAKPSSTKVGTVTASVLNVRKGNSTSYGVVTKIKRNEKVTILETKNKWHKIKTSKGKTGWVSGDYIKL